MTENTQKEALKNYWLQADLKDQKPITKEEAIGQLQLEGWLQYAAIAKQLFSSLAQFQEGADFSEYENLKQKMKAGELTTLSNEPLLRIVAELEKEEEKIQKLLEIAQERIKKRVEEDGRKSQKDIAHQLFYMETQSGWTDMYKLELIRNPLFIIMSSVNNSLLDDDALEQIYKRKNKFKGLHKKSNFGTGNDKVSFIFSILGDENNIKHEMNHALYNLLANTLKPQSEVLGIEKSTNPPDVKLPEKVRENSIKETYEYAEQLKKQDSPLMIWSFSRLKNELLAQFAGKKSFSSSAITEETPILEKPTAYDFPTQWIYHQAELVENQGFGNVAILMSQVSPAYFEIIKPIIEKADELAKLGNDIPGYLEILPWILIQIPMDKWLEKINDVLIPDIEYRKKYLTQHPAAKKNMDPTMSGFRYYRAGLID